MQRVSLEQLSDLVLVDITAALPMCAAVRLAQLGHQRLQAISCRPWVLRRMADVNFNTALKASQAGGRIAEVFCSEAVLRRMYGRIGDLPFQMGKDVSMDGVDDLLFKLPAHIRFFYFKRWLNYLIPELYDE